MIATPVVYDEKVYTRMGRIRHGEGVVPLLVDATKRGDITQTGRVARQDPKVHIDRRDQGWPHLLP